MTDQRTARTRKTLLLAAYALLTSGLLFLFFRTWVYDDPFITYRYAANLTEGAGFVYNPGERVLSTTSPLFALVLAALHSIGAEIPMSANLVGALSLAAGGLMLWDICRQLDAPVAGWVCAALYPSSALLVSTLGSETPLYLALSLGAVAFYLRRCLRGYVREASALAAGTNVRQLWYRGLLSFIARIGLIFGSAGCAISCMCASCGVRQPFFVLHARHEQTTLSHVVFPPRLRGST
jgi:hypothetical protein